LSGALIIEGFFRPQNGSRSRVSASRNLPVAGDGFKFAVVATKRNVESDHSLAGSDQVEVLLINARLRGGLLVEEFDLLEETWFLVIVESGAHSLGSLAKGACSYHGVIGSAGLNMSRLPVAQIDFGAICDSLNICKVFV